MGEVTTGDIKRAYDSARACFKPLKALRAAGDSLHAATFEDPSGLDDAREQLESSLLAMRDPVAALHDALQPILDLLHSTSKGRVDIQGNVATSIVQAFARYMDEKIDLGERLLAGESGGTTNAHNLSNMGPWQPKALDVEFDFESARAKDYVAARTGNVTPDEDGLWSVSGDLVRLEGDLRKLTGQSRRIMQHMIRRFGQPVDYTELAEHVWGDDYVQWNTIQQGFAQLRKDLKIAGAGELTPRIHSERGSYRFL